MRREEKVKSNIRLNDAEEYIKSAEENLDKGRYKASLDHSVDAVIAANDAFTIFFIEQIPSSDHKEAVLLHKEAGKRINENKAREFALLLEERHSKTYRPVTVTENLARDILTKSKKFLSWIKEKIS